MLVICIMSACCGIQQQLPSLLGELGFETAQVSAMVSFFTASLAVGKILQGVLYSKAGIVRGSYIMVCIFAVSFLMLMNADIVYFSLIALAFGMGVVTTLMPMIARFAFGPREFASIWSILATASSVGSFAATPLWGLVYDATETYNPAMIASSIGLVIALIAMVFSFRDNRK
jgi:predicted MFS family arabinose efflux permease